MSRIGVNYCHFVINDIALINFGSDLTLASPHVDIRRLLANWNQIAALTTASAQILGKKMTARGRIGNGYVAWEINARARWRATFSIVFAQAGFHSHCVST